MTRDDWIWVAIRIFGLYLVARAILTLARVIGLFAALVASDGPLADDNFAIASAVAASQLWSAPITLVIQVVGAWYFLRGAPALSRFIQRHSAA